MRAGFVFSLTAVLVIDQSDAASHKSLWLNSASFLRHDQRHRNGPIDQAAPVVVQEECSCNCCEVAERTPEEIKIQSVWLKCALKFTDVDSCSEKCAVGSNLVLPAGTSDKGINYDRFCFYYCQPFDTAPSGPCIEQNATEQVKAATSDGNGEDLHLPPQGSGDFIHPNPPTTPPPPPTLEEMPCHERLDCIETLMAEARGKAEDTWWLARESARAARAAANGEAHGENIGAHEGNPGPGVITGEVVPR